MATITRHRDRWQAQIYIKGHRESRTFRLKSEARAWAGARERDLRASISGVGQTVADLLRRYRGISERKKGAKWEATRIDRFIRDLGPVPLKELSPDHIARWRDDRLKSGVTSGTVRRELILLGHACEMARREWGWLSVNPCKDVTKPQDVRPRTRRFTDEEIESLCHHLGYGRDTVQGRTAAVFLFALETAMRCGEICALRRSDVIGKVAHVRDSKTGQPREVPLSPRALEIWADFPDGFGLTPMQVSTAFRRGKKLAGVDARFHDSRREATSRLSKIFNVLELARITGHRDIRQLMTYYQDDAAALAERF